MESQNFIFVFLVLICALLYISVKAENGCPPAEDILPCVCFNSPHPVLECSHITDEKVLRDVFAHSRKYNYKEVHIHYASLKYLPKELFENTGVSELHLSNSTLNALFDSPPQSLQSLYKIHLENTKIIELSHWELLEPLTHLRILTIYFNNVESIDSSISKFITKDISQISLYATETRSIQPGAFVQFKNLDKLAVDNGKLKEISRDVFATPSGIRHIYFNENQLRAIPDNMFVEMPNLVTVGLKHNLLTTLPQSAFGGNAKGLDWLFLDGNLLKCNCDLRWIVTDKPKYLSGSCATPIRMHDKPLKDLTEKDFKY